MPSDDLGTLKLNKSFVTNLKNLSLVDGQGLAAVQTSLANIVGTPNLTTTLTDLNELGKNYKNVEDLAEAMEDLADAMKEVNEQSKNTSRGRNAGRGNNESSSASASIVVTEIAIPYNPAIWLVVKIPITIIKAGNAVASKDTANPWITLVHDLL